MPDFTEALSLDDIRRMVREQVDDMIPTANDGPGPWIEDVYLTYAVIEVGGQFFRAPFGNDGASVTVAPRNEWQKVSKEWVAQEAARRNRSLRTSDVHELVSLTEATLDAENYTVQGARLIRAGWSDNGRAYPDHVLAEAATIWDGVKAYADHPSKSEMKNRPERSVRDIVGVYETPRHQNGATYADLRVIGEARQWLWPLISETMETGRSLVGLSINALGKTRKGELEGRQGIVVEAITHANSVDVVTEPAAGGGFDHLLMSDDGWTNAVLETVQLDEFRAARPDLIAALQKEWTTPRDSEALVEANDRADRAEREAERLREDHRTVTEALDDVQAKLARVEREVQVDRLLAGKALPPKWRASLRADLMEAKPATWDDIVAREMAKLKDVKPRVPVHGIGRSVPAPLPDQRETKNVVTESIGVVLDDNAPRDNESFAEWQRRTQQQ